MRHAQRTRKWFVLQNNHSIHNLPLRLNLKANLNCSHLHFPPRKYKTESHQKDPQMSLVNRDSSLEMRHTDAFLFHNHKKISTKVRYLLGSALLLAELAKSLVYGQHQRGCILGRFITGGGWGLGTRGAWWGVVILGVRPVALQSKGGAK